ncbi:GNAT family N-acetyltransferase [Paenibacillus lycopersici]|uniref:GNAT family N-acetyltransferase n=1 Tax=Paenibacillus lycopersici TaxID=2704462 RepID=A0A6C0G8L1_9BACL|nr:GNAT family N-acetyltransferase [Paenibacillus lycopersici]QHT64105.1 GNAT family N-acetyltransferase [Paenibacillus lycopersici]
MIDKSEIVRGTGEDANVVRNKLIAFNAAHVPNGRYEEINLHIKNEAGEIIAGLNSAVCWNWMEVDILWVADTHRGQGLGKRLLEEAERIARANDCAFVKLNTFSFQAPRFYQKHGYQVMFMIDEAPAGQQHYYLKKDLE